MTYKSIAFALIMLVLVLLLLSTLSIFALGKDGAVTQDESYVTDAATETHDRELATPEYVVVKKYSHNSQLFTQGV